MHVPLMMSVLIQPIIVTNVGIMIQIAAIAENTRRFLALSYKTLMYLLDNPQYMYSLRLIMMMMMTTTVLNINNYKLQYLAHRRR